MRIRAGPGCLERASAAPTPRVGLLADDVEALLVRVPEQRRIAQPQSYLVPIDACYEFVGRLRMLWRGFDGGQEAREFIDAFFTQVAARAVNTLGDAAMTERHVDVTFAVLDVAPEPYTVSPVLTARVSVATGRRPGARHRAALPGPYRAAATFLLRRRKRPG